GNSARQLGHSMIALLKRAEQGFVAEFAEHLKISAFSAFSAVRHPHSSTKRQAVDKLPQADILSRTASQPLLTLGVSFHSAPIAQG
ncbi:MAG TPA: hypothetical protein VMP08_18915, partial [Anaerolineae bacterium]|nr:hypothetical protein [Anaerolineae bacterium]